MDSLLESNPDSAYALLTNIQEKVDSLDDTGLSARQLMYKASAQNKLYLKMPSDTIFQSVVDYYAKYGTANDRMKSLYLMGCIYRDKGEAPLAMKYYQEALDMGDTSDETDLLTLLSIYGQMADLSNQQNLPDEEIHHLNQYIQIAEKLGNKYEIIHGKELKIRVHYLKDEMEDVIRITKECHQQYLENGMTQAAAKSLPTAIQIFINNGYYSKAHELMEEFENNSGLFNNKGEIVHWGKQYYYTKGLYFLGVEKLDSAEFYFRKIGQGELSQESYRGLLNVYERLNAPDSIHKYLALYEKAMVDKYKKTNGIYTSHISSLYNYKRNEKIAERRKDELSRSRNIIIILLSFVFMISVSFLWYKRYQRKRRIEEHNKLIILLDKSNKELTLAKSKFSEFEKDKSNEINEYERRLLEMEEKYGKWINEGNISMTALEHFKIMLKHYKTINTLGEWEALTNEIKKDMPAFHSFITAQHSLTDMEKKICILFRVGFRNKEIMILLGENTMQSVTNLKSKARKKLFPESNERLEVLLSNI